MRNKLCKCGCGGRVNLASKTSRALGHKLGEPVTYISGHYAKDPQNKKQYGPCRMEGCTNRATNARDGAMCRTHYTREYAKRPDVKERAKKRRQGEHHKQLARERTKRYNLTPRGAIRRKALNTVNHEITIGRMKRQGCRLCGERAHAHHHSYLPEHWLDVDWLCPLHHKQWHMNNKPTYPLGL